MASTIEEKINLALQSNNSGDLEEGRVAQFLLNSGINIAKFQHIEFDITTGSPIGDIDIETVKAIIEVTLSSSGKLEQIKKLYSNRQLNPAIKPVILCARKYGGAATLNAQKAGFLVPRSYTQVLQILANLP